MVLVAPSLTANMKSARRMKALICNLTRAREQDSHLIFVGCENVPHFGQELDEGRKINAALAEGGILHQARKAVRANPGTRAILLERSEMPFDMNLDCASTMPLPITMP